MSKKKIIIILSILVIVVAIISLYGTFATNSTVNTSDSKTYNVTLTNSTSEVTMPASSSKTIYYKLSNTNKGTVKYGVAYSGTNITVKIYADSNDPETGLINYGENKFIKLYIQNTSTTDSTATITTILGYENGGDLIVPTGKTLVTEVYIGNAVKYITNLYTKASKTEVTNNSITYNYDTTNNLMEDVAGNIRYYGASPNNYIDIGDTYKSDVTKGKWEDLGIPFTTEEECKEYFNCSINYASFGYSSEDECNSDLPAQVQQSFGMTIEEFNNTYCVVETIPKGTPILYRIIGVFGDKIKLIRNESIGGYSWDTSASTVNYGSGINEWSQADLMKLLNPGYESNTDLDSSGTSLTVNNSLYYNSGSGTCYNGESNATTTCDFTSIGLSDNVKTKIAEVTWNLGGWNSHSIYPNQIYENERGTNVVVPGITCSGTYCNDTITRTTSWTGKVALAYPSDYGYAADLTQCNQTLVNYDNATCKSNNWLYNSLDQWLLTPYSSDASYAWSVYAAGDVNSDNSVWYAGWVVRPVLYLNSELVIESGIGTESDPYRISA